MKKVIVFVIAILFMFKTGFPQDIISRKNGEEIKSKIISISSADISFKKFDNPHGSTYTISKSAVSFIKYENGTVIDIKSDSSTQFSRNSTLEVDSAAIVYDSSRFYRNRKRLNDDMLEKIISESNKKDAIRELQTANILRKVGQPFTTIGIPATLVGCGLVILGAIIIATTPAPNSSNSSPGSLNNYEQQIAPGITFLDIGIVSGSFGISSLICGGVIKSIGKSHKLKAVNYYNSKLN